ncbi:MAG: molybdopterin synthase [Methanomethylovorans sp.]|uniref:molybdopterin synthase n=1 Tax=Methanomethylovorans sp. TaxID=2758717 RepID=UPI000B26366E|nr:molybdopterin synthase [Methanomethylovorans sp.]
MKVISVVGYKGTGKTTLVTQLVKTLSKRGKVGTVKQMFHHRFNPKNTDTGKHFDAGAEAVVALTDSELVLVGRNPSLSKALDALADKGLDFAVVEGAKKSNLPKIVLGELENINEIKNVVSRLPARGDWNIDILAELVNQQEDWITLPLLIEQVKQGQKIKHTGGIGTFTGIVRQFSEDVETKALYFEKYEKVAEEAMQKICHELMQREGVLDIRMHHRTGTIGPGEDIVYIVVAAAHRQELFIALSDALEMLKSEVPVWKKELTLEGGFWVHDMEK